MGSTIVVPEEIEFEVMPGESVTGIPLTEEEEVRPVSSAVVVREKRKKVPPQKETEEHRKMRAAYLAMGRDRSVAKVAAQFGYNYLTVQRVAKAFGWYEDAKDRDGALNDAFVEEHRAHVNKARKLMFFSIVKDIEVMAARRGISMGVNRNLMDLNDEQMKKVVAKLDKKKEMRQYLHIDSYKEMNDLINALRKVVYEWQPSELSPATRGVGGFSPTVKGNLNVQLIIEK